MRHSHSPTLFRVKSVLGDFGPRSLGDTAKSVKYFREKIGSRGGPSADSRVESCTELIYRYFKKRMTRIEMEKRVGKFLSERLCRLHRRVLHEICRYGIGQIFGRFDKNSVEIGVKSS